jgi:hypothetical protein
LKDIEPGVAEQAHEACQVRQTRQLVVVVVVVVVVVIVKKRDQVD